MIILHTDKDGNVEIVTTIDCPVIWVDERVPNDRVYRQEQGRSLATPEQIAKLIGSDPIPDAEGQVKVRLGYLNRGLTPCG